MSGASECPPDGWLERNVELGSITLGLLWRWNQWVHRRVESVTFLDPRTVVRSVSVDFTLPINTSLLRVHGEPVSLVPLGLLRKRKLTNFSLRDQSGDALPLITKPRNGAVAAAVLLAYARAEVGTTLPKRYRRVVPQEVVDDLWTIANHRPDRSMEIWERLGHTRTSSTACRAWRDGLVSNDAFLALAGDLAQNFIVLTPVQGTPCGRRVFKFAYEEYGQTPPLTWTQRLTRARHKAASLVNSSETSVVDSSDDDPGAGIVRVVAFERAGRNASPRGVRGVTVLAEASHGSEIVARVATDTDGEAVSLLSEGTYTLTAFPPPGYLGVGPPLPEVEISRHESPVQVEIEYTRVGSTAPLPTEAEDVSPAQSLTSKVLRAVAIRPKRIVIAAPAVGQCRGYHLEFAAPEGLMVTGAALVAESPYDSTAWPQHYGDEYSREQQSVQRVHLHLPDAPPDASAVASVYLRPRTSTIVRAAILTAMLTTALLALVAKRWDSLTGATGQLVALLLIVPGGLGIYVARSREHPFTTEVLVGLRMLALLPAVWAAGAATIAVVARTWSTNDIGAATVSATWGYAQETLVGLAIASALTLALLLATLWQTRRAPEKSSVTGETGGDLYFG